MTDAEIAALRALVTDFDSPWEFTDRGYGLQDPVGTDIALLRANLRLTPEQRLDQAQAHIRQIYALRGLARRTS
ncbi:MAG: hypothetical protein SFX74_10560 [Fimbriimonadaceae bacterium]|nr:hypothetical protein [Fimbriimonadaceae bacterium]